SVQDPEPLQVSWFTHALPASPQRAPARALFARHPPLPSHVSGSSHSVSTALPHAVPALLKPLSWHAPPWQVSWLTHALPASPQLVPLAALLVWQAPAPSQVSAASHAEVEELPQAVPA